MKKKINLYSEYLQAKRAKKSTSKNWNYPVILGILALLIGVYGGKLMLDKNLVESELNDLRAYVSNTTNLENVKAAEELQSSINSMHQLTDALTEINGVFEQKQSLQGDVITQIKEALPSSVTLQSVSVSVPSILVTVVSTSNTGPSEYVDNLTKLDFIEYISYPGYTTSGEDYTSTFTIMLKGGY